MRLLITYIFRLFFSVGFVAGHAQAQEGYIGDTGKPGISKEELALLKKTDFAFGLKVASTLAFSDDDARFWAGKAKFAYANAKVEMGDPSKDYDVIIQLGHYPRKRGATGSQGAFVSEQEVAALVALGLKQELSRLKLDRKPINVILVGADDYTSSLKSRVFLALHTDGAKKPCIIGPSVAYQKIGDASGMHAIALAVAITLSKDADKFMSDNYTKDEAGYYAFKQFDTSDFKGLIELAELTCPDQEKLLLERAALLSKNLAYALQFALRPPRMFSGR